MKRNFYHPNSQTLFSYSGVAICCLMLCSLFGFSNAHAQLSGTYTIGGAGADYPDFTQAIAALETEGAAGPLTFKVNPGTYNEQVVIRNIPGSSCGTPVSFEGAGASPAEVSLQGPEGTAFALQLEGVDGVEFRHLSIVGGIQAGPGTDCFRLENNILLGTLRAASTAGERSNRQLYRNNHFQSGSLIKVNEAPWNPDAPVFDEGLIIEGNTLPGGSIIIEGQQDFSISNNRISSLGQEQTGIAVTNSWYGKEISGNILTVGSDNYKGTAMVLQSAAAARISRNHISSVGSGGGGLGLAISTGKLRENEMLIANNRIHISGYDARGHNYFPISNLVGLEIDHAYPTLVKMVHNTIRVSGYSEYVPNYALSLSGGENSFHLLNNVISNASGGTGIIVNNPASITAMDYNNLFMDFAQTFARLGGQEVASLTEWQAATGFDAHSMNVNPSYPINPAEEMIGAGIYVAEVPEDFYGQIRSNPPTIGAIEKAVTKTPLSGVFTIGGENPDYASFTDAIAALEQSGIKDSILFKVRPGEYVEQLSLGALGENTKITFEGESGDSTDVVLRYPFDEAVLLQGTDQVTIRYLTIASGLRVGNASRLLLENNIIREGLGAYESSHHTYRNNLFTEQGIHKRGRGFEEQAGVRLFSSDEGLAILDNTFEVQGTAIDLFAQSAVQINNNHIRIDGEGETAGLYGMRVEFSSDIKEINNNRLFSDAPNTTGIRFFGDSFAGDLPRELTKNKIVLRNGGTGIDFGYYTERGSPASLVANNLIAVKAAGKGSIGIKIYLIPGELNFFHNSVYLYGEGSNSRVIFMDSDLGEATFHLKNNILANVAGGMVLYGKFYGFPAKIASSDYNDLYTNGDTLAVWEGVTATNLAAWQQLTGFDAHSLAVDPQFESGTSLIPGNLSLQGAGIAVEGVNEDFFGKQRPSPPTLGAVELEEGNQPPVVSAGADKTLTLPASSITLSGTGRDPDGRFTAFLWEKVSGPSVTMNNANTANVQLSDLAEGQYVFRFSATDNEGTTVSDEMKLTVHPAEQSNQPPVVSAGVDRTVLLPRESLILSGTGRDPDGRFTAFLWEKVSGPSVSMNNQRTANLVLTELNQGTYVFRFSATDNGGATASDEMTLQVQRVNQPPLVSAGADKTLSLPASSITLSGTGRDPDGRFTAFLWEKVSGPSVTMHNANTANVQLSGLVEGQYVFRFSATDNEGATTSDEMKLTVHPAEPVLAGQPNSIRVSAYPNTFNRHIAVDIQAAQQDVYRIEVLDMLGRVYYRSSFVAEPFSGQPHTIDFSDMDMKEGMYVIRVENQSRSFQQVVKVVKRY